MTILFVVYGSLERLSGGYLYDRKVIEFLKASGDGVDVLGLEEPDGPGTESGIDAENRRRYMEAVRGKPYDVIVFDAMTALSAASLFDGNPVPDGGRPAVVSLFHMLASGSSGFSGNNPFDPRRELALVKRSDLIIANSFTTLRELAETCRPAAPTAVCLPGKDGPGENPYIADPMASLRTRRNGSLELLAVGNLLPGKGYHLLAEILAGLRPLPFRLTIAGSADASPEYAGELSGLVEALGLADRVTFAGGLEPEALRKLYLGSDLFLQASYHESYGIALAEAQYYGLPFIAFDTGAASETGTGMYIRCPADIPHGKPAGTVRGGFLIPAFDGSLFAMCIRRLSCDRALLESLGRAAFRAGAALPSWRDTGAAFRRILNGFLGEI